MVQFPFAYLHTPSSCYTLHTCLCEFTSFSLSLLHTHTLCTSLFEFRSLSLFLSHPVVPFPCQASLVASTLPVPLGIFLYMKEHLILHQAGWLPSWVTFAASRKHISTSDSSTSSTELPINMCQLKRWLPGWEALIRSTESPLFPCWRDWFRGTESYFKIIPHLWMDSD